VRKVGKDAFPYLIENWNDDRYSMRFFHSLSEHSSNLTIGDVCRKTLFDQLQPYSFWPFGEDEPRGKPKRPSYPSTFLDSKEKALEWWETNKDRSLFEIQAAILDWVINEETKRPMDFSEKERDFLSKLQAELKKSGEMPPGNFDWMQHEL
jgi:hypothetical protein